MLFPLEKFLFDFQLRTLSSYSLLLLLIWFMLCPWHIILIRGVHFNLCDFKHVGALKSLNLCQINVQKHNCISLCNFFFFLGGGGWGG